MKNTGSILKQESKNTGGKRVLGIVLVTIICSVISVIAAIGIIASFEEVIAKTAIFTAKLIGIGIPVGAAIGFVGSFIYLMVTTKRRD